MNYIEELKFGDTFEHNNTIFVLSTDFKSNGQKMCVCLMDGSCQWLEGNTIVSKIELYTLDKSNNILPIKTTENKYAIKN